MMTAILELVERHLRETGMTASRFGRNVTKDARFVYDLRRGRRLKPATQERVRTYLADPSTLPPQDSPAFWTSDQDEHLWAMVGHGISGEDMAYAFGVTVSAVRNRVNRLADERLPDRPRHIRLADAIFAASQRGHPPTPSL